MCAVSQPVMGMAAELSNASSAPHLPGGPAADTDMAEAADMLAAMSSTGTPAGGLPGPGQLPDGAGAPLQQLPLPGMGGFGGLPNPFHPQVCCPVACLCCRVHLQRVMAT